MTASDNLRAIPSEKLLFLAETVLAEAALLCITDGRLFAEPMTAERADSLKLDNDLAERVDAFVARFGCLQDTVGDKLLPAVLACWPNPWAPPSTIWPVQSVWAGRSRERRGSSAGSCATS